MINPETQTQAFRDHLDLGRLQRLREQLRLADCAVGLFYDPINIRYATGTSNMQVYSLHNPCRYVFVATDGPVILFDFHGCEHLSENCAVVDEVRDARAWYHFNSGPRAAEDAEHWCDEIVDLLHAHSGGNNRIAVDKLDPLGTHLLEEKGIHLIDGQEVAHLARLVKTPEEIMAIRDAVAVCQLGINKMRKQTEPGMTEQAIWSILHQTNIEHGGEWIETRLLSSGPRTNPWYQECSSRVVDNGDMISLDSDLVGPHGYSADISRSWIAGDKVATDEQRQLYALAHEQVTRNCELFAAGRSYFDVAHDAWHLPKTHRQYEQPAIAHGIGLCNEYPLILHEQWIESRGHDGELQTGMVFCIESYAGELGGSEGVKLEQQILVTDDGFELLSDLPFESGLI